MTIKNKILIFIPLKLIFISYILGNTVLDSKEVVLKADGHQESLGNFKDTEAWPHPWDSVLISLWGLCTKTSSVQVLIYSWT